MAISFDAGSGAIAGQSGTTLSWTHVTSASATIMFAGFMSNGATGSLTDPSSVTYNSVAMTLINKQDSPTPANRVWLYYLVNPASGSHSVSVTWAASQDNTTGGSGTYIGAATTGVPDSSHQDSSTASATFTPSTTVVASNCWIVGIYRSTGDAFQSISGGVNRGGTNAFDCNLYDTNATVGTGSQSPVTITAASAPGNTWAGVNASFAPTAAAGTSRDARALTLLGVG